MEGWIKLHRKMINWEWYNDINVKVVFLHLLLTANHEDKKWQGIEIKRGQKITSLSHLAEETKLSVKQIRNVLNKLKSTGEITIKGTNKYTIITIVKYNDYQIKEENKDMQTDTQTDKRRASKGQTKGNKQE